MPRTTRTKVRSRAKLLGAGAAAVVAASGLAACGGSESGVPELVWYTNPDSGGQAEIASRCTDAAQGALHDHDVAAARATPPPSASSWSAASPPATRAST